MKVIGIRGLRGGVGTTSIVAGLAHALAQQGMHVLAVDLCQDNMLGLHFGIPNDEQSGWSNLINPSKQWHDNVLKYANNIDLLLHGGKRVSAPLDWLQQLSGYNLILLDMPLGLDLTWLNQQLTVIHADTNCHVRLYRHQIAHNEQFLLSQFSSRRALQQDLLELWLQAELPILQVKLHRDEMMVCALAAKQPIGYYAPESMIANEIVEIANLCLQEQIP